MKLIELANTTWSGVAELWLDPLGNEVSNSDCTLQLEDGQLHYTWSHEGKPHRGSLSWNAASASFVDTFHSPEPMECRLLPDAWGLLQVEGRYGADDEWGWRISLCHRTPMAQLVLQMTNIAPWGEESRAVRMVCDR